MNVLICDDVQQEADKLAALMTGLNTVVFNNANDTLEYMRTSAAVDVCFLDIVMPGMDGVALAKQLRGDGYKGRLVFLSASREYGPEAFQVKAFTYLLKPPTLEAVSDVLRELEEAKKNSDTNGLLVKSVGISRFVLFREISHIEVINHKVYVRLTNGDELETRATFAEVASQLLKEGRFIQCHRSYVINMDAVCAVQGNDFVMRCGTKVSISKSYSGARARYLEWVLGVS